jgi:succinyl-diaminopimelate desuccinylase
MPTNVIETTEALVRIQSTADRPEELQRAVQFVADYFDDAKGLIVRRYESGHKPSIVISTQETLTPDILMVGHLDVVPAIPEMFEPRYEGTKMLGRGVCDMKSECAVMMRIMREVSVHDEKPNIALMLTTDEEIGGFNGVNYLVNEIGYRAKVALVPDGGQAPDDVVLTCKGVLMMQLTAKGVRAHGSRPWLGDNAIEKLIDAFNKIRAHIPNPSSADDRWQHTCNIGIIAGGEASNQVPDFATADIDIRHIEGTTAKEMLKEVQKLVPEVEVTERISGSILNTDKENVFVKLYAESLNKTLNLTANLNTCCGSNDGRFLSDHGIPIIISRPVSGDQHSPDEWLETESLVDFHRVYMECIKRFDEVING